MNNIQEARELIFDKNNHIYFVTLHKKIFGGYYYEIKYRDKYFVDRVKVFPSTHKTKEKCLMVLDNMVFLSGKNFKRFDNIVVNFANVASIQHNNTSVATFLYSDDSEINISMTKKQFTNLFCEFLSYKDKNMCR